MPRTGLAVLLLLTLTVSLAPVSLAHNPALSVHAPVELGDGLLVIGEEGTVALLERNGTAIWQEQLDAHLFTPPIRAHGVAVSLGRAIGDLTLTVYAMDEAGLAWQAPVGEPGALGYLTPSESGFLAITREGQATHVASDGSTREAFELPFDPVTAPTQLPSGTWAVAGRSQLHLVDDAGRSLAQTQLSSRVSELLADQEGLQVVFGNLQNQRAGVLALDEDLETRWATTLPGIRIGGTLAQAAGTIYLATYHPDGAYAGAIAENGTLRWETPLGSPTAAAASTDGERVYLVTTEDVRALDLNGQELWRQDADSLIHPARATDGLLLPPGADDQLRALDPATGEVLWTWSDGVRQVPWTDEGLVQQAEDLPAEDGQGTPGAPIWALLMACLGVALLVGRYRTHR
ncbi:MAG: PQQ-binding-like beta-propeller repeat protein [Candidatus Thermoplasmatota archaeon]|nr:PQQ-binding-like beta-propeller repeat protein [Candidatus Thermoplasmatota archaeon]